MVKYKKTKHQNTDEKKVNNVPQLVFKKLNDSASSTRLANNKIMFGFPKINQIIYPGQTVRINTGWSADTIPTTTFLHTIPHKSLLDYNLISIPETIDYSQAGSEVIQSILNNGKEPVKIQSLNPHEEPRLIRLHPETLEETEELQFNFMNFLSGVVSAGTEVATLFA